MPYQTIPTHDGRLWYADQRTPDAAHPPLLLIHGAGGSHLDWHMSLRRLNALVPDLPGHGKSDPPGRDRIDAYASDLIALLDALDTPQVIACGHSMGGAIAQTLALEHPDRVRGLILIGTGARLAVNERILEATLDNLAQVGEWFKKWMWGKNTPDEPRILGFEQLMKNDPQVVYGDYVACNQFDATDRLGEIAVPALVIGATGDRMTPLELSAELAQGIPQAQQVTIDDAGHMMTLEQPAQVAEAVEAWLARLG